jgi:DNA-binding PadR family transcriptional regulator
MKQKRSPRLNLWALMVMSLLRERPRHPYEMQRQIRMRHQDQLLVLKPGSLYHAIDQMERGQLIAPVETSREGRWPERTVYRLTERGEQEFLIWLRTLLSKPIRESEQFMAALAHMQQLTPEDAMEQLESRAIALQVEVATFDTVVRAVGSMVGRTSVIEVEYARAMRQAELDWIRSVIDDMRGGHLTWDVADLHRRFGGPPPKQFDIQLGDGGGPLKEQDK